MTSVKITHSLPPGLERYKTSSEFTPASVPKSLLTAHSTKTGVWGLLRVRLGRLYYCLDDDPREKQMVERGGTAVIAPEVLHHVELLDANTAFLIEFHRAIDPGEGFWPAVRSGEHAV
jgi:tellurite resistance-related uncharacterized protein